MYFILFFNITTKIHFFLWTGKKNEEYPSPFRLTKCYCPIVKNYFLPHENGITIAGNIFSHIYMERIYLLLLSKRQKMFFLSPLLYE